MTPNFGALGRDRAHQPDLALVAGHGHAVAAMTPAGDLDDFGAAPASVPRRRRADRCGGDVARVGEQHDLALHDGGEMVLDRGMNVGTSNATASRREKA